MDGVDGLGPVRRVAIDRLRPADSPRSAGVDLDHVRLLVDAGPGLPPITVHRPTMRVIDGMHRLRAAVLRGETEIGVRFFEGTSEEAFVLGVRANTEHGLPLTAADRRTAARRILAAHPRWSDGAVAASAGISPKTVAALRTRSGPAGPGGMVAAGPTGVRIGRDGRARPVDSAEGRRTAGRLLADAPEASLREIARQAGISPGTVRDVRDRIGRGEDPVPLRAVPAPRSPVGAHSPGSAFPGPDRAGPDRAGPDRTGPDRAGLSPDGPSPEGPGRRAPRPTAGFRTVPADDRPEPDPATEPAESVSGGGATGGAGTTGRLVHLPPGGRGAAQVESLFRDPSLRLTENGRLLLRMLQLHSLSAAQWDRIAASVPAHSTGTLTAVAAACAEAWQQFAERMEHRRCADG
ncbi:ParB N-terminal domain-containing protein [Kitasatospora cinereorecta]|uniref:ParB N-terminal domain-containing protein n=1 Tax=Kitasatospora cinereorecta TaxID=285560 RepID=A0ABW0VMT5_9ACTN